ncbi:Uncharacterised protein [Vibrio cholerae]|nr:Uncharacterised protein [Vibrio cholerae]
MDAPLLSFVTTSSNSLPNPCNATSNNRCRADGCDTAGDCSCGASGCDGKRNACDEHKDANTNRNLCIDQIFIQFLNGCTIVVYCVIHTFNICL